MENPTLKNLTDPNFGKPPENQSEVSLNRYLLIYNILIYNIYT